MCAVHEECNNYILYAVRPHPMQQEMSLRIPDPLSLSAFRGRVWHETIFSMTLPTIYGMVVCAQLRAHIIKGSEFLAS